MKPINANTDEMLIDLRTAFHEPPVLYRAAFGKGIREIALTDIRNRRLVDSAALITVTDGAETRTLKSRDGAI